MTGKGPRFAWTDTTDKLMLLTLLGETKLGAENWAAVSKALEAQGFLNSDGKAVGTTAIQQHFSKVRTAVAAYTGSRDANALDASSQAVTPKKRGRPAKSAEQKASDAAKSARGKGEKAAGTPSKTKGKGGTRGKKVEAKAEAEEEDADGDDDEDTPSKKRKEMPSGYDISGDGAEL